jgi:hypothetical protein
VERLVPAHITEYWRALPPYSECSEGDQMRKETDASDEKTLRLTRRQVRIIDALARGAPSQKSVAAQCGVSEAYISRLMARVQFRRALQARTAEIIARGGVRAASRLVELLDGASEHVSLHASIHTLRLHGFAPPESGAAVINLSIQPGLIVTSATSAEAIAGAREQPGGYLIDLRGAGDDGGQIIEQEPSEQSLLPTRFPKPAE